MNKNRNPLTCLLLNLNVKFTAAYANKLFNEHPHKYDLYGISKMLSEYNINNAGIRVNDKKEAISTLTPPFIAQVSNAFVTVNKILNDKVYYRWDDKKIENNMQQFLDIWSGIVLVAETNKKSIEPNYQKHRIEELFHSMLNFVLGLAVFTLLIISSWNNNVFGNVDIASLIIVNIIGAYIGYLLVLKQINIQSSYADKICSLFKQGDCNNVLESSAAKLFGLIGWSEIGLGYFLSNIFILTCMPSLLQYVIIANIVTLPYTIWSIWYQRFRAKQWCPLCLAIQIIFWGTFAIDLVFGMINISLLKINDSILVLSIYGVSILLLNTLIQKIAKGQKVETIIQEMNSIKMKDEVFLAYIKDQPYHNIDKSVSNIMFGNTNSSFVIAILTNPYCAPCSKMHKRMEDVLTKIGDQVCLQYIFSSFNEELDHSGKFLVSVYLQKNHQESLRIFNEWFEVGKMSPDKFYHKHSEIIISEEAEEEYSRHQKWKSENKLSATPTILINGYELPDIYKVEELGYFTELEISIKNHS